MKLQEIPIDEIEYADRARMDFGDLSGLEISISKHGLYQPISVRPSDTGAAKPFMLIAGRRRLQAYLNLKKSKIPCVVRGKTDDLTAFEIEALENLERKDFTWQEKCRLVAQIDAHMRSKHKKLADDGTSTQWGTRETAKLIGKSVGGVYRSIELAAFLKEFPDLGKEKTEDAAVKKIRSMLEAAKVAKVREEQKKLLAAKEKTADEEDEEAEAAQTEQEKKLKAQKTLAVKFISRADSNFRVGDVFDGLEEMRKLRDEQNIKPPIALCEIDPPYGIDLLEQKKGESTNRRSYEEIPKEEYPVFLERLCDELYDVLPKDCHVVFWHAQEWYPEVCRYLREAGFNVDVIPCIWVKPSGQTNAPDRYLGRAYESFIYAWKGDPKIKIRGRTNVFSHDPVPAARKYHPTQRPISLMLDILNTFCFPGQIVFSPFLGSGTTLLAAYRLDLLAWGYDLSEKYKDKFMAAAQRELLTWYFKEEIDEEEEIAYEDETEE